MNKNNDVKKKVSEFWRKNGGIIIDCAMLSGIVIMSGYTGFHLGHVYGYLECLGDNIESIHKF